MSAARVVITGIGAVTAIGATREATWEALIAGQSGISAVTLFDASGYRSQLAAEIPETALTAGLTAHDRRRLSRGDRAAVLASAEALGDAGLGDAGGDPARAGVFFGAGTGDLWRNEEYLRVARAEGLARAKPSAIFNHFPATPVDVVGSRFGYLGPRACIAAACSSSTIAIGLAGEAIRRGDIDVALAGGADVLCRLTFSGFNALRLVDTAPCRPFETGRAGMTIGEAGAVLVLESFARARRRGARIYAELLGFSATCEAFHATSPEPDGVALSATLDAALRAAGVAAGEVDHVNAHGTGTVHNDRAEARAYARVFGERARRLPVTSIKSSVGHCLGAAGAIEAAALAMTIARGVIPPTLRHASTDPECAIDVVANDARDAAVRCGVSTSLAFGGNDAAVVLRRV